MTAALIAEDDRGRYVIDQDVSVRTSESGRLTSRKFQPASRLVVVLSVIKQPNTQINYGTGKDVSDETIADAKEPLKIKWFGDSFIDVPVRR